MQGWIELFRSLGESLIEVVRAEAEALQGDLKRSGRHLAIALALIGAAVLLLFWVLGLLIFCVIALLSIWLPLWGAALTVLAVFSIAMFVLIWLGVRRFRLVENPVDSVKRHVDDHLDWWQNGLMAQGRSLDLPAAVPIARESEEGDLP
ncbi:MAG TPA: phage holin family protein [Thermoanaerobaculia bacterium]|nr:phage holin family protein [Thermoanaerobaculia bacterium]